MSSIHHVNVVSLLGISINKDVPWIVMEYMKGGDLYSALIDPFRLAKYLDQFSNAYERKYNEYTFGDSELHQMRASLQNEIDLLKFTMMSIVKSLIPEANRHEDTPSDYAFPDESSSSSDSSSSDSPNGSIESSISAHPLSLSFLRLLECGERHWIERTAKSHAQFSEVKKEVFLSVSLNIHLILFLDRYLICI